MELIILGSAVSLLVQWLKTMFGTKEYLTLAILLFISLVAAVCYTYLVAIGYWQTVAAILLTAGAFYTFVLQRFESSSTPK
jgi:CHASE2 domain-containing sensor protein